MAADPRGTTKQRGYTKDHWKLRERYKPLVAAGKAICPRCNNLIKPGSRWHLGHADHPQARQLGLYHGPEHPRCNVGAANKSKKTNQHPQLQSFFGT